MTTYNNRPNDLERYGSLEGWKGEKIIQASISFKVLLSATPEVKLTYVAARLLKDDWKAFSDGSNLFRPILRTIQNDESYAAAAIEFYFLRACRIHEILPNQY